jgi:Flp pilus assembly protein TadG
MRNDPYAMAMAHKHVLNSHGASRKASFKVWFHACLNSDGEGQALIECAVVLPVLLLLISGIFWAGIAFYNFQQLCAAVSQGVVALAEGQNTGINPCTNAVSVVTTDTKGLIPYNSSNLSITTYEDGSVIDAASCPTTLASGTPVSLKATYHYAFPFIGTSLTNCCTLSTIQTLTTP